MLNVTQTAWPVYNYDHLHLPSNVMATWVWFVPLEWLLPLHTV